MEATQNQCFLLWIDDTSIFFKGDPGPCIENNYISFTWVRNMSLQLPDNVEKIGDSIGDLAELTHLEISHCKHLKYLPDTITRLHKLEVLSVLACEDIQYPTNLDQLVSLRHLSLQVADIKSVPDSLFNLSKLESLDLRGMFGLLTDLPEKLNQLVSLKCLSLWHFEIVSVADSIAKLSNLVTLNLYYSFFHTPLPKSLNLSKLKLIDSRIKSLPTGLCHLEIESFSDKETNCDIIGNLEQCSDQLTNLETLSFSCHYVKFLPSISRLHSLQELVLKGCYNLEELPADIYELVKLSNLDISDTKIKSLPCCITKLPSLMRLSLPKCFRLESLPSNANDIVSLTIDDTDTRAYVKGKKQKIEFTREDIQPFLSKNMRLVDAAKELGVTRSTMKRRLRKLGIQIWPSSRNKKYHCANRKKSSNESSSGSDPSDLITENLPNDQANHEKATDCLVDASEYMWSDNIQLECAVDDSTLEATTAIVNEPRVGTQCHSNGKQEEENLSIFVVKATYKAKTVRFELCSTASFHVLNRELAKNLELNLGKFKTIYIDEDGEWMLMTMDCHLKYLINLSKSSGNNIIRLSITDGQEHAQEHFDGANQCTSSEAISKNGSSNTCVVKATYKEDTVRFNFSCTTSFAELREQVAKNLELELHKFKIKYED